MRLAEQMHAQHHTYICTWCNPTIFPTIHEGTPKSSTMHNTGLDNDIKCDIFENYGSKSPLNIRRDVIEGVLEIAML